jgi:antitoxin ParD1/3/4
MPRTITFQPTEKMGAFIEKLVDTGDFNNQSEVIRAGIRLLEEQTASSKLHELRRLIREGEESYDLANFSMDDIKRKLDEQ